MRDQHPERRAPLVLLVEDEVGLSKLMVMILEDEGFRVVAAANGAQGLVRLKEEQPALILTDYMMPELNGYEMARVIRKNPAYDDTPILMTSAALPQQLQLDGLVDAFLPKGSGIGPLVTTIRQLIEGADGSEDSAP
ncbi:chemotaxis protein CheY [Stutzerimonas stutzeri]|uniref:Chemotaxis protein CheY n=1 Tax=Stutzerimonas stutzeri TaxID=316 RepID=W8R8Y8_STUST|nr:response regulator [Stutzerimonas stutzeri]AHL76063.1 chemotaxis protein CheY [Stutzerimonas stutzeri]MCQ4330585.1 response regulator [Stutzerimonas stutzeri]